MPDLPVASGLTTPRRKPRIGVITAMWGRLDLTDIIFSNVRLLRQELADVMDIIPVVGGSEGEASRRVAERNGFAYIEVENSPLGRKWNAALSLLKDADIDGVLVIGSDDLVDKGYFLEVLARLQDGHTIIGPSGFSILDRFSGRLFHWQGYPPPRDKEPIGLGRFIHRQYLDALQWELWDSTLEFGLDYSMWQRLQKYAAAQGVPFRFYRIDTQQNDVALVDVKHKQQMWMAESVVVKSYAMSIEGNPCGYLRRHFPEAICARVFGDMAPLSAETYPLPIEVKERADAPSVAVFIPKMTWETQSDAHYQAVAMMRLWQSHGYRLDIVAADVEPLTRKFTTMQTGFANKMLSSLTEFARRISDGTSAMPSAAYVVGNGGQPCLTLGAVLKRLHRQKPGFFCVLDMRFTPVAEVASLLPAVDGVIAPSGSALPDERLTGKKVILCDPCALTQNVMPVVPYQQRYNVAVVYPGLDIAKTVDWLLEAPSCVNGRWAQTGLRAFLVGPGYIEETVSLLQNKGIPHLSCGYSSIFGRIFRAVILPPGSHCLPYYIDLLAMGCPLICDSRVAAQLQQKHYAGFIVADTAEEALRHAEAIHNNEQLWHKLSSLARKTSCQHVQSMSDFLCNFDQHECCSQKNAVPE